VPEDIQQSPNDNFVNWIKTIPGGWKTGSALLLVLAGAYIYYIHYFPWKTEGEIIVDEPKVYTRERLVNDRFAEEAWLKQQLKVATRDNFLAPEASISSVNTQQLAFSASATNPSGSKAGQEQPPNSPSPSETPSQNKAPQNIAPTPADTFADMKNYRDIVRSELMDIQLDDRHDIGGNTLYRLNFDSSIIPGDHTLATAVILVTVTPNNENEIHSLYQDWMNQTQTMVDSYIEDKFQMIHDMIERSSENTSNSSDDPFNNIQTIRFEQFLRNQVCKQVKSVSTLNSMENQHQVGMVCAF